MPVDLPIDESRDPADSRFPAYDRSKALGNDEILAGIKNGLDAVIVAPTAVLGPYDFKPSRMGAALIRLYQRKFPTLVGGGYDWVDVRDVVRGALKAEEVAPCGSKYILSGEWATVRRIAEIIETVRGVKPPRFTCPQWLARAAAPFSEKFCELFDKRPLFTREALLNKIWGYDYFGGDRTVDVHIRRLRAKIEGQYSFIETVRGIGYRFIDCH